MSDRIIENSPMMSPDSLRQFLKMNKGFYNLHTDKNYGLDDTGGIKYVGTVENFGSEILIESNKLRLNKPPIESLNISSMMKFYFDLSFEEELNDIAGCFVYSNGNKFYKQNMVCCLLQRDRMIDGYKYEIIYNDISLVYHLGSRSKSDENVYRTAYFETTTPPILRITDRNESITETDLVVDDGSEIDTRYYFPINYMTLELLGLGIEPSDMHIRMIANNETFTINLNSCAHDNIPYIWFCVDKFRTISDFELNNNLTYDNKTLLTPGMDGHGIMHLYPSATYEPCVPSSVTEDGYKWWIKVYGDFSYNMSYSGQRTIDTGKIYKIEYLYSDKVNPTDEPLPLYRKTITYNDSNFKIILNDKINWDYEYPKRGEYDYDPTVEFPIGYMYIEATEFDSNYSDSTLSSDNIIINNHLLKPAFDVMCDDRSYVGYFKQKMNHAVSGIHIDYTSDFSNNGVYKPNGAVHGIGQFDGLPKYYNKWKRDLNRGRVELYSIRDNIFNKSNPMDNQTAGLIIDSGIPQTNIEFGGKDDDIYVEYIYNGIFDTTHEPEYPNNCLTDLGYHDNQTFTWTKTKLYTRDPKFIYHGNGVFSLGMQGFDPNKEIGRIYLITNDSIIYENNDNIDHPKPPRTAARICDIPTSFTQLMSIKNISPTYVLDPYYVRTGASWNTEQENMIWNELNPSFISYENTHIFNVDDNLDSIISDEWMREHYSVMSNFNQSLDMSNPEQSRNYSFSVYDSGTGYVDQDEVHVIIGGVSFDATVNVNNSDEYTITVHNPSSQTLINISNIPSIETYWNAYAVDNDRSGMIIKLTVDSNVWNDLQMKAYNVNDKVYVLKFDSYGRIWAWNYSGTRWIQDHLVVGEEYISNYYYDEIAEYKPINSMKLKDVMLYNNFLTGFEYSSPIKTPQRFESTIDQPSDLINHDETFYCIYNTTESRYNVDEFRLTRASDESYRFVDRKMFPEFHNIKSFYAYTPVCKLTCDSALSDNLKQQPTVMMYNPMKNIKYDTTNYTCNESIITNKSQYTLKDVIDPKYFTNNKIRCDLYGRKYSNDVSLVYDQKEYYKNLGRSRLMQMIYDYDHNAEPIVLNGSDSEYTDDMLVDYVIERTHYTGSNALLIAHANTQYTDVIEIGGYTEIQEAFDGYLYTNNGTMIESIPTSIYKIDLRQQDMIDLNKFRMYDEDGNDVSMYCMILIENKLYTFAKNKWIKVQTQRS